VLAGFELELLRTVLSRSRSCSGLKHDAPTFAVIKIYKYFDIEHTNEVLVLSTS
jgi:hypothetical protein